MTNYKLYYFPLRGRAELARQIFAIAREKYEDIRIPQEKWPEMKDKTPFRQMPVLEVDGKQLGQSIVIGRYLARKFGLAGKNSWEEAKVDSYADQFMDFFGELRPFFVALIGRGGDPELQKKEVAIPAIQKHMPFFVKAIKDSGSGYVVGNSLTYVDLMLADFTANFGDVDSTLIEAFPALSEHRALVHSNPNLKHWIETRPKTPY